MTPLNANDLVPGDHIYVRRSGILYAITAFMKAAGSSAAAIYIIIRLLKALFVWR